MEHAREQGLWKRGVLWLLLLGPLFFASYGFANWFTGQRDDVGSLVFAWEPQIPLCPWTIVPYWSIDLLYGLSFLLPTCRREMDRHALRLLAAQLICVACFLLWPLRFTFERPPLDGTFGLMFDVLMGFDKPFNQAPSLHITLLVIIWAMFANHTRGLLWRGLLHLWMALIGISVLTTWQHHFIDVPTGALAGFVCLWLLPLQGDVPLQQMHLSSDPRRWRLALCYSLVALACTALAVNLGGAWLWLFWPAVALTMVALNYLLFGAGGFQKQADGRLSPAATVLLAPYLLGAWINSRLWTYRQPKPSQVVEGVHLGRLPATGDLDDYAALVDLCAELPLQRTPPHYCSLPSLDLVAPDALTCLRAAEAIEHLRHHGPLLVCCALGYSRSATAVAAWLLHSGRCHNVESAVELIRQARPQVVLGPQHLAALQSMIDAQAGLEVAHAG
ncbi:phosphatase PAP2/dual specificity phosphatase family protein [Pseudomonas sp. zfem001]|uniref:phosphatase PAP2/dual specificity phosphatase family protein n=1 Tax=Pseudomonas sp. zfem001 TaxID=3078196 RepID=UPI002929701B|nr:phosphatase PAP2/dual specificity phosphatase family protein [Pseudomonas sp. zfem001]MDU9408908.1 phosphatase PAP2/dual specificity phosphatase family protein [Pseudomonas sp. zfem001]